MVKPLGRSISLFKNLKGVGPSAILRQKVMPENEVVRLATDNFETLAKKGAEALRSGNVIAVPTDTVYGLAADAQNNSAIASLYKIKSTNLVGIRIPDYPFIQHLAELHQGPIALTSANQSSEPSTLTPEEFQPLWPSLRLIFDGGNLGQSSEHLSRAGSTVIDLSSEGYFRIIRRGSAYSSCKQLLCDKYNLTEVSDV
ncbi:unnamed protein product [Allacma fusca]|uniref:YrdC-like domain-containing protein n=1 Tax=Allacma fusca TaxID=39272 RepID=A0A8J2KMV0_9HEXA|nr:unnamed protein product [Allacma fusca]